MPKPTDIADSSAADLVRWYRTHGMCAVLIRMEGTAMSIICQEDISAAIAKMLYAAADTMADRAIDDERRTRQ